MKFFYFATFCTLFIVTHATLPWISTRPTNMRGGNYPTITGKFTYSQSVLISLGVPAQFTAVAVYGTSLANTNYSLACSCIGVDMGSRIDFDLVVSNLTATSFTTTLTIASSSILLLYAYKFDFYPIVFDLGANFPLLLQGGFLMSSLLTSNSALIQHPTPQLQAALYRFPS